MRAVKLSSGSGDTMVRARLANLWAVPELHVTAFRPSAVYTEDRHGEWLVGQRQEILHNPYGLPRATNLPRARWKGLLSSRWPREDDDGQPDSKAARHRDQAGSERSRMPTKEIGPAHGRPGKKTKPLKPGLY